MKSKLARVVILLLVLVAAWAKYGKQGGVGQGPGPARQGPSARTAFPAPTPSPSAPAVRPSAPMPSPQASPTSRTPASETAERTDRAERSERTPPPEGLYTDGPYRIGGVTVVDIHNGRTIPLGTVDLRPTLERIAAGEKDRHANDGTIYQNRSRALPHKPSGYYHEYVVPTRGVSGPGPQRLIIGKEGELYYTPDHYDTFIRVEGGR